MINQDPTTTLEEWAALNLYRAAEALRMSANGGSDPLTEEARVRIRRVLRNRLATWRPSSIDRERADNAVREFMIAALDETETDADEAERPVLQGRVLYFEHEIVEVGAAESAGPTSAAPRVDTAARMANAKALRERTGATIGECLTALTLCRNDVERAADYLRSKGVCCMARSPTTKRTLSVDDKFDILERCINRYGANYSHNFPCGDHRVAFCMMVASPDDPPTILMVAAVPPSSVVILEEVAARTFGGAHVLYFGAGNADGSPTPERGITARIRNIGGGSALAVLPDGRLPARQKVDVHCGKQGLSLDRQDARLSAVHVSGRGRRMTAKTMPVSAMFARVFAALGGGAALCRRLAAAQPARGDAATPPGKQAK